MGDSGSIEAKFHIESPWDRGTKIWSNGPGHMTKMATMPIYGKKLKNLLLRNQEADDLGMQHWVLEYYQVCSSDDPGLTLTYFTARSNLVHYAFVWEKGKTMKSSETIVVFDLKLATDDRSDKQFLLTSKFRPQRGYMPPAPGLSVYMY